MTERTAAETERPGGGKTLGELAKEAYVSTRNADYRNNAYGNIDARDRAAWQAAAEAIQAALIPCTFPSCLSAQTAAKAGEEIARLKGERDESWKECEVLRKEVDRLTQEPFRLAQDKASLTAALNQAHSDIAELKAELSNLISATKGQTFYHSDEAVNAEMGRLRGEVAASEKCCSDCEEKQVEVNADAYKRGVEEERERWKSAAIAEKEKYGVVSVSDCAARAACDNILDVWRAASPAPQKNTAECQEVCRWTYTGSCTFKTACGGEYVYEVTDPGTKCPSCGKRIDR